MEHGTLYYLVLGAGVVLVPAITDRLLKDRVAGWLRITLGVVAVATFAVLLVVISRLLGF
jgi:hypothetical protein